MRRLTAALVWLVLATSAFAQGCGPSNPNCIVPDVSPPTTSNEQAANTKFVQSAITAPSTRPGATGEVTVVRSNTSGSSTWTAFDAYGSAISCGSSTTNCVQEAVNVAMPYSLGTTLLGFDLNIIGGDEIAPNGTKAGGAAVVVNVTAAPITFPALQGKRIRSGAVTYNCAGCTGGLVIQFDSLEMVNVDFEGSQTVAGSNPGGVLFKPVHGTPLDLLTTIVDSRIYFKTLGGQVHFDWSGGGTGINATTFETGELNAAAITSGCALKIDSATAGVNVSGNRFIIDHLHALGSGSTAICIGTAAPTGGQIMGQNYWQINITPDASNSANGIDTWASSDEIHVGFNGMNTGYSIKFEPGACNNKVFMSSTQASPTIIDNGGCAAGMKNTIFFNGGVLAGNSTTAIPFSGKLTAQLAVVGTGADTTEDTLQTFTMPANVFDVAGRGIHIEAWGTTGADANNKTVRIYFGTLVIYVQTSNANAGSWYLWANVFKTGSNAQVAVATGVFINGIPGTSVNLPAQTDTAGIVIKITGQNGTAVANDIICYGMSVQFMN